jgi:CRP-like cAMP-binding protein
MRRQGVIIPYPTTNLYKTEVPYQPETKEHQRLVLDFFRAAPIFSALSDAELAILEKEVVFERFGRGERILEEGAVGDSFYLLVSGECTVIIKGDAGQDIPLSTIQPGGVFGEMSLLSGKPRSASVDAAVDVEVARISKSIMSTVMNQRPELLQAFAHYVALRAKEADEIRSRNAREVATGAQDLDEGALRDRIKRFFGLV